MVPSVLLFSFSPVLIAVFLLVVAQFNRNLIGTMFKIMIVSFFTGFVLFILIMYYFVWGGEFGLIVFMSLLIVAPMVTAIILGILVVYYWWHGDFV